MGNRGAPGWRLPVGISLRTFRFGVNGLSRTTENKSLVLKDCCDFGVETVGAGHSFAGVARREFVSGRHNKRGVPRFRRATPGGPEGLMRSRDGWSTGRIFFFATPTRARGRGRECRRGRGTLARPGKKSSIQVGGLRSPWDDSARVRWWASRPKNLVDEGPNKTFLKGRAGKNGAELEPRSGAARAHLAQSHHQEGSIGPDCRKSRGL